MATLGPRVMWDPNWDEPEERPVRTLPELKREFQARMRLYGRALDVAEVEEIRDENAGFRGDFSGPGKHYYPYLEAKMARVTPFEAFPLAVCPEDMLSVAKRWLKAVGFTGKILTVTDPSPDDWIYGAQAAEKARFFSGVAKRSLGGRQ